MSGYITDQFVKERKIKTRTLILNQAFNTREQSEDKFKAMRKEKKLSLTTKSIFNLRAPLRIVKKQRSRDEKCFSTRT